MVQQLGPQLGYNLGDAKEDLYCVARLKTRVHKEEEVMLAN